MQTVARPSPGRSKVRRQQGSALHSAANGGVRVAFTELYVRLVSRGVIRSATEDSHQLVYRGNDGHLYELWWLGNAPVQAWDWRGGGREAG